MILHIAVTFEHSHNGQKSEKRFQVMASWWLYQTSTTYHFVFAALKWFILKYYTNRMASEKTCYPSVWC